MDCLDVCVAMRLISDFASYSTFRKHSLDESVFAQFAANPRLLISAKWCFRAEKIVAVDPNGPGFETIGCSSDSVDITTEHGRSKTIA